MIKYNDYMEFMAVVCWTMLMLAITSSCSSVQHPVTALPALSAASISATQPSYMENPNNLNKKFNTKSTLLWMKELVDVANCTIHLSDVRKDLLLVEKFTHTTMTPAQVSAAVESFKVAGVRTYRTKNPFSAAIATTYASDRENLYLNTRKNPRDIPSMVNTLFHESSHLNGFGHGDNNPKGKELSVPYYFGAIGQKYAHKCIK